MKTILLPINQIQNQIPSMIKGFQPVDKVKTKKSTDTDTQKGKRSLHVDREQKAANSSGIVTWQNIGPFGLFITHRD